MTQRRVIGYDILRIIAISMVVVIHSHSAFLWATDAHAPKALLMLELTALCVLGVPLFFMISGALLLDVPQAVSTKDLFLKRIKKQAIPFVLWSLAYLAARIVMKKTELSFASFAALLHEPAYYQFWFMYTLFAIYLLLPILQQLVLHLSKKQFEYLLIIWFVFSCAVPFISRYCPAFAVSPHVDLILCEGYIGYFLLGYYLKKYAGEVSARFSAVLLAAGILLTGLLVFLEWHGTSADKAIAAGVAYGNYLFPAVAIGATGAFLLFQNHFHPAGEKTVRVISGLSDCTLGVFYLHMFIITLLEKTVLRSAASVPQTLLKAVATIAVCFAVSKMCSYIPFVNEYLFGVKRRKKEK